ncbi:hypothetical protein FOXG_21461 [Fusarium oxysporum f. sp. lycopersici 4287]|uniref:Uncharacterized protein n=1 Tax=Fusarium oxysporum f. sp. lycopersici (strain 4287 / CBS 123668 / FGSC 9935 / NRRL 34936) TaxID=426428 RepID=A0A0J9VZ28_FUSO4|nr:hypothetical protein FOXG_21461 [Fusarium oxysporum f. sp. lycopersici 4287]KAJ9413503.1 hypothetical protein QL093DRAFT_2478145 [Fusarium oxysporum]KNB15745.1 hypothetical protein FOXG_21461 [Fusarium oxysporum f. sp. lycopersici 4287]
MGVTVTPSSFFLSPSPDSVRVGRFIRNIKYPLEGYYDPTTDEPNVIETQVSASTINRQNSKTGFGSALTSSTSIEVSKRLDGRTHVVPADVKNGYYLDNSDAWFDKAVSLTDTRKWIEKAALSGGKIYIIVGIEILTNTRLVQNSQSDELRPTFIEKRVCLLQYRKVKTRWFSTRLTKPLQLSTTRQWSYTKGLTSYFR